MLDVFSILYFFDLCITYFAFGAAFNSVFFFLSFCDSYSPKFVKEYVEQSKPIFSVGEFWDSCNYPAPTHRLDYNQGIFLYRFLLTKTLKRVILQLFSVFTLYLYICIFACWLVTCLSIMTEKKKKKK